MKRSLAYLSRLGSGLGLMGLCACALPEASPEQPPPLVEAELVEGYPALDQACVGPSATPSHLVVTSTDFHTGAVGLVDLATLEVQPDLAQASSDAIPFVAEGRVFVVNRFGFDYIDELAPDEGLELVHQWPLMPTSSDDSANPHTLFLGPTGRAWVTLHGAAELHGFRFPTLQAAKVEAERAVNFSAFADADGIPELSFALRCGEIAFIGAERIDRDAWAPLDDTLLIPLRLSDPAALFAFADESPAAIHLLGTGTGPWQLDPEDPAGHTIVMLNSGLERIDLASGTSEWWVPEARFAEAGYGRLQLSGFDLDSHGRAWLTAASADFSSFALLRIAGEGAEAELELFIEDIQSVTGDLEIVDDIAYVADTTIGASGLRAFALSEVEDKGVTELPQSPLALGLPPMSIAPL